MELNLTVEQLEKAAEQSRIDVSNLRFYARLFREHKWESPGMCWNVFSHTLDEVAARIEAAGPHLQTQPELSHLVRDDKTLCGRYQWIIGNTDMASSVKKGLTNCAPCLRLYLIELLNAQAQPQQVSGSLVDRALSTWFGSFDGNLTPEQDQVRRMGNVLREFADELLKPILFHRQGNAAIEYINAHLESVRARLFAPTVDPEERVTVQEDKGRWTVRVDDTEEAGFQQERLANALRLGLIAQLRADAALKEKEHRENG